MADSPSQQDQEDAIGRRLLHDYADSAGSEQIAQIVHDSYDRLAATARITVYLPVLVERLARERLDAALQAEGKIAKRVPEVLFVCVHNAGRSQMAAALTRYYAGNHLHIRTGGSDPGQVIHPEVVHAMKLIGLSLDEEFPKPLTSEVLQAADVVITMGCGDECPIVPGRRYEDWPIEDPARATADRVAVIRDDIDHRVKGLLSELLPDLHLPDLPLHG